MNLVEDFFHNNFRDVTSRETIEWGELTKTDDGNFSIRYKYRARIWDRETKIINQVFTFNRQGAFVSVNDAEKRAIVPPTRVYEVGKKVSDFPDREDMSTPRGCIRFDLSRLRCRRRGRLAAAKRAIAGETHAAGRRQTAVAQGACRAPSECQDPRSPYLG